MAARVGELCLLMDDSYTVVDVTVPVRLPGDAVDTWTPRAAAACSAAADEDDWGRSTSPECLAVRVESANDATPLCVRARRAQLHQRHAPVPPPRHRPAASSDRESSVREQGPPPVRVKPRRTTGAPPLARTTDWRARYVGVPHKTGFMHLEPPAHSFSGALDCVALRSVPEMEKDTDRQLSAHGAAFMRTPPMSHFVGLALVGPTPAQAYLPCMGIVTTPVHAARGRGAGVPDPTRHLFQDGPWWPREADAHCPRVLIPALVSHFRRAMWGDDVVGSAGDATTAPSASTAACVIMTRTHVIAVSTGALQAGVVRPDGTISPLCRGAGNKAGAARVGVCTPSRSSPARRVLACVHRRAPHDVAVVLATEDCWRSGCVARAAQWFPAEVPTLHQTGALAWRILESTVLSHPVSITPHAVCVAMLPPSTPETFL